MLKTRALRKFAVAMKVTVPERRYNLATAASICVGGSNDVRIQ